MYVELRPCCNLFKLNESIMRPTSFPPTAPICPSSTSIKEPEPSGNISSTTILEAISCTLSGNGYNTKGLNKLIDVVNKNLFWQWNEIWNTKLIIIGQICYKWLYLSVLQWCRSHGDHVFYHTWSSLLISVDRWTESDILCASHSRGRHSFLCNKFSCNWTSQQRDLKMKYREALLSLCATVILCGKYLWTQPSWLNNEGSGK